MADKSGDESIDKKCIITNQTTKAVVVIDAYDSSEDSTAHMYEQDHLNILKTTAGPEIINAAAGGTVLLDDYYEDKDGQKNYKTLYNLIIALAGNLFPVKAVGEMLSFDNPPTYPPVTVKAADLENMQLAGLFHQQVMAFPSSGMAEDFQTVLSGTQQSAGSTGDIDSSLSAFFAKYPQFKTLSLDNIVAISTYYGQYANIWADFQDTYTYYLYSSTGSQITSQGRVVFSKRTTSLPAETGDHNGGYTITYIAPDNSRTGLDYSEGQLVSSTTLAIPPVCLQGVFQLKSTFTQQSSDNVIIPVLSGMVNGIKVMGTSDEKTIHSSFWLFFHPDSFQGWLGLIMNLVGVLFALQFAWSGLKMLYSGIKKLVNKWQGKEPPQSEVEELRAQVNDMRKTMEENTQKILDRLNSGCEVPEDLPSAVAKAKKIIRDRLQEDQRSVMQDNLEAQAGKLEKLAEYGVDENLETAGTELRQAMDELKNASADELDDVLNRTRQSLQRINEKINTRAGQLDEELNTETREALQTENEKINECETASDKIDDDLKGLDEGEIPEIPVE